jgi:hypothetical protein
MRNKRIVAVHRGGELTPENHRHLIRWARECAEHVLPLSQGDLDSRLLYALKIAMNWENGMVKTGVAMKASVGAHAAAREYADPVSKAIARAVGQAVATAHMADHAVGASWYALKAAKLSGKPEAVEKEWQIRQLLQLPAEIAEIIQTIMKNSGM